jgi:hypothetical protein
LSSCITGGFSRWVHLHEVSWLCGRNSVFKELNKVSTQVNFVGYNLKIRAVVTFLHLDVTNNISERQAHVCKTYHTTRSNGSLVTAIKPEAKEHFHKSVALFLSHILQQITSTAASAYSDVCDRPHF